MKKLKLFNICLCLVAILSIWATGTVLQNKFFVTVFLSVVICFWMAAKGERLQGNNKIIG